MKIWLPLLTAVAAFAFSSSTAFAGCDITLKAENKSLKDIQVQMKYSSVRTKLGTWAGMTYGSRSCQLSGEQYEDIWLFEPKSGRRSTTCELDFACNAKRRYKFRLFHGGNALYWYYPSDDAFTSNTTIDLGNVGRHFRNVK